MKTKALENGLGSNSFVKRPWWIQFITTHPRLAPPEFICSRSAYSRPRQLGPTTRWVDFGPNSQRVSALAFTSSGASTLHRVSSLRVTSWDSRNLAKYDIARQGLLSFCLFCLSFSFGLLLLILLVNPVIKSISIPRRLSVLFLIMSCQMHELVTEQLSNKAISTYLAISMA